MNWPHLSHVSKWWRLWMSNILEDKIAMSTNKEHEPHLLLQNIVVVFHLYLETRRVLRPFLLSVGLQFLLKSINQDIQWSCLSIILYSSSMWSLLACISYRNHWQWKLLALLFAIKYFNSFLIHVSLRKSLIKLHLL